MSGSPVAAISLSLYSKGTISDVEAFAMINGSRLGASFIVLFNAHHEETTFTLPPRRFGTRWMLELTTADPDAAPATYAARDPVVLMSRSVSVLRVGPESADRIGIGGHCGDPLPEFLRRNLSIPSGLRRPHDVVRVPLDAADERQRHQTHP